MLMPQRKAVPMIISMNMNLKKKKKTEEKTIVIGFVKKVCRCSYAGQNEERRYLIMSSIIFPMEICRVPRDSWAGRMYARRVKLSMLVTANSTSAISWGSSWCQSLRTARQPNRPVQHQQLFFCNNPKRRIWYHFLTSLSEVDTLLCAAVVLAEEDAFEHDEHTQGKGRQVHAEHHHVQAVPPVQEVAPQPFNPHFLALIPEESCRRKNIM